VHGGHGLDVGTAVTVAATEPVIAVIGPTCEGGSRGNGVLRSEDNPVGAAGPSLADSGLLGCLARGDRHAAAPALGPRDLPGSSSVLGGLATDLATEHGENDPNKRDRVKQAGRKDDH
jgi:hypothetical protein